MNPRKFNLKDAVDILLDSEKPVFFKTWVLARLMAWICLDQRGRMRDPRTGRPFRPNRQRRDAKLAGHLALASLLHREIKTGTVDWDDDSLTQAFLLFFRSGGFEGFLESPRGGRGWLKKMKVSTEQILYVHKIMDYLCRHQKFGMAENKFNIECAKKFVEKTNETVKARTFGKYWEESKQAAPYIFAFYAFLASTLKESASIDQFIDALGQLGKNDQQLNQLLGHAAYAADILVKTKARGVRRLDFRDVRRVEPHLAAFDADECTIIGAIEARRPLSKEDLEDYRPRTLRG
jgi:hypothetical protein